jgi:hypothetical protein
MSKKTQDSGDVTVPENPQHVTLTIAKGNTGKFDFSGATITVDFDKLVSLATEGFKGEIQSLLGPVDKHPLFGDYEAKGQKRPDNYERGSVEFTEARAEVVRSLIAKGTDLTGHIAVTVTSYLPTTWIVAAKDSIKRKADTETSLVKLATASGFEFEDWHTLTIDNVEFVKAVAAMLACI